MLQLCWVAMFVFVEVAHFGRGNKSLVSYEKELFINSHVSLLVLLYCPAGIISCLTYSFSFYSCTCITYETVDICLFELQEQLLLEPMFEVPGSDIVRVLVEEDTARGYHPARYQYNDPSSSEETKADQPPADESSPDSNSEIKTSVL